MKVSEKDMRVLVDRGFNYGAVHAQSGRFLGLSTDYKGILANWTGAWNGIIFGPVPEIFEYVREESRSRDVLAEYLPAPCIHDGDWVYEDVQRADRNENGIDFEIRTTCNKCNADIIARFPASLLNTIAVVEEGED